MLEMLLTKKTKKYFNNKKRSFFFNEAALSNFYFPFVHQKLLDPI